MLFEISPIKFRSGTIPLSSPGRNLTKRQCRYLFPKEISPKRETFVGYQYKRSRNILQVIAGGLL